MKVENIKILFVTIFFIVSCNKFQETTVATVTQENPRAPTIPAPERIRTYDVQHIKINVSFDWNEKKVIGDVETRIVPLADNFEEFEVDAVGFNIASVWDDKGSDIKYNYDGKKIKIDPDKNYSISDTIVYSVNYTCQPQRGLYFIYPTELNPSLPYQIWTQGEQEDHRHWIPVYDYPNDKTTFEIFVTIDEKYKTLSNGYLEYSRKINNSNERQDHWIMDKPNSTYLIMLAAGEFNVVEDKFNALPVQSYTDRNILFSESEYTFRNTPEMVKVFETKFQYKYPWNKYAQVVVENFIYGGMENTSATVLNKRAMYNKEVEKNYSSDALISHELGHQWWGDLVTCRNWSEMWLNESFAEYSTVLWKGEYSGKDEYDYEIFRNGETAFRAESTVGRYPIWAGYGSVTANLYDKGSVILNTFRYILGDSIFFRSLGNFLKEHEFKNVVTEDFVDVINRTYNTSNNSNENFKWMFDQWIWRAGFPEFKVKYEYDENAKQVVLNIKQTQTTDSLTPVFRMPVDIRLKNSSEDKIERIEILDEDETFYLSSNSKPEIVVFDHGNKIFDKTFFDKYLDEWKAQFTLSEKAIDRIMALTGAEIYLKEDTSHTAGKPVINYDQTEALNLFRTAIEKDSYWGVRVEAVKILGRNFILDRTGIVLKDSYDSQTDPRVKREILKALGNTKRSEDIEFVKNKIQNETDNFIVADGIRALGKSLPPEEVYDVVIPFVSRISHRDIIQFSVIEALDSASQRKDDVRIKKAIMDIAFGTDVDGRLRISAILALKKYAKDEDVKALALKYSDFNFILVKRALISLLSLSEDKTVIPVLNSMNEKTTDESLSKLISSSIKKLEQ